MCRFLWVLFSHRVRYLSDEVTPAGSRPVGPRSERWFSLFLFPFWTDSSRCCHHLGRDCFRSHSRSTKTFLNLSWGGSGPSRWTPPFEGRVGGRLPHPFTPEASFSVLLPLSFGMRSPYRSCALVGSHFYTTGGCRWCLALDPSGWASSLCLRFLFAPCGCRCVSW